MFRTQSTTQKIRKQVKAIASVYLYHNRSASTVMRLIQFNREGDSTVRTGVVTGGGEHFVEYCSQKTSIDMISLIKEGCNANKIIEKTSKLPQEELQSVKVLPPISNPEKIVCIGLNYSGHCLEQNKEPPKEPMFFSKFASSIVGSCDGVCAHSITKKLDWEVELAVIIGKKAKNVDKDNALDYVFGYTVAQDISARDWQKERNGGQFLIGKTMDTFCPLGPYIVHKSAIPDPHNLKISCQINGVEKQNGNTKEMIFNINEIISRLTTCITLKPGDVILTGTPAGVGMHRNPPEYLKPGDLIESEIENIGKLVNIVVTP